MNKVCYDEFVYFRLTWYSQVTFIFAMASDYSVEHFLLRRKKIIVRTVVQKQQGANCARYTKNDIGSNSVQHWMTQILNKLSRWTLFISFFFVANLPFKYDPALFFQNSFPTTNPV